MLSRSRVYLDNAATSWPKPALVAEVVDDYLRRLGNSVGRGGYAEAEEVGKAVEKTRTAVARLIGAESSDRIIFTLNGTDSLNLSISGIVKPGDHVVTTVVEHNSVLRPLRRLEKHNQVEVTRVGCDEYGIVRLDDIQAAIRANTKLIVVTHASNVTGTLQPIAEIGAVAREHGILFLVDAAQTVGHIPLSVSEIGADLLAAPGHKGLLGPLGTGILYIRPGVEELVECVRQGGTGSASSSEDQPDTLPEKYESGSHNAPGIIGLGAGIGYLEQRGMYDIRQHAIQLTEQLLSGLSGIAGVEIYGPRSSAERIGIVSVTFAGQDAPSVAKRLEDKFRVQVRGGFQCAALMHRALGTFERQGTVRFSIGPFSTADEITATIEAAKAIAVSGNTTSESVSCPCVSSTRQQDRGVMAASLVLPPTADTETPALSQRSGTDVTEIPGLRELWSETIGDPRVCIAVLDGPVDISHPCFQGADIQIASVSALADPDKGAATQHGTHVASVIFGQHHSDVKGIAPGCHGVIIPVFRDGQNGEVIPCSQIDLARAITLAVQYAEDRGSAALLINISGGQLSPSGEAHPLLDDVVKGLSPDMHLIVSAAGNQGCDCLHIPGAMPSVLAVGAMRRDGTPLPFSNWGKSYQIQGILAIGEDVPGATVDHGMEFRTGTSYATPVVTGITALLLSAQLKRTDSASAAQVREAILASAVTCEQEPITDCRRLLAGRLDARSAFSTLINQGTHVMPHEPQQDLLVTEQVTAQSNEQSTPPLPSSPQCRQAFQAAPAIAPSQPNSGSSITGTKVGCDMVLPAGCGCGGSNGAAMQKVYAIGRLAYDFGTRQRMDYFRNQLGGQVSDAELIKRVSEQTADQNYNILEQKGKPFSNRPELSYLTWVLQIDATPVYALAPVGAFAVDIHDTLVQFLQDQLPPPPSKKGKSDQVQQKVYSDDTLYGEGVERMAVGGVVAGEVSLYTGEVVPVLQVDYRTLANWTTSAMVDAVAALGTADPDERVEEILDHLYESTRNLGIQSRDRALNFAATMAVTLEKGLGGPQSSTVLKDMILDYVDVQPSPICRPDADCWDVVFTFFDPIHDNRARRGFRYTIDVTDTFPAQIPGSLRPFIAGSRS